MTFSSFSELFNSLTSVDKGRYFCEFESVLGSEWTRQDLVGGHTGTSAMNDAIDGGFQFTTSANTNDENQFDFNNKQNFSNTSSAIIAVFKALSNVSNSAYIGLHASSGVTYLSNLNDAAYATCDSLNANYTLVSNNNGNVQSQTSSGLAIDTNYHSHKIGVNSASLTYYIDGVLKVTYTGVNLPASALQPVFGIKTTTTTGKTIQMQYLEAFNI